MIEVILCPKCKKVETSTHLGIAKNSSWERILQLERRKGKIIDVVADKEALEKLGKHDFRTCNGKPEREKRQPKPKESEMFGAS